MPNGPVRRRLRRHPVFLAALAGSLIVPAVLGGPMPAVGASAPATLTTVLAHALAPAAESGAQESAAVVAPGTGRLLGGLDAGARLAPGPAWGVATAAAALWHLGPTQTVTTRVLGPSPRSGTILGSLVLVGAGDPLLSEAQIAKLAQTVAKRAKLVTGAVLGDGAMLAYPQLPSGWPLALTQGGSEPPAAALAAAGDAVTLTVTPAKAAGTPATVKEEPAGLLPVTGSVVTAIRARRHASPTVTLSASRSSVAVAGAIPVGAAPVVHVIYPPDPVHLAALLFLRDLEKDGVQVQGGVGTGLPVSGDQVIAGALSSPLSGWLPAMWAAPAGASSPSPLVAENLFRLLCAPTPANPCPAASDEKVVLRFLAAVGGGTSAVVRDGSGLAVTDAASADTLARVLEVAALHGWGSALVSSLPRLSSVLPGAPAGAVGVFADTGGDVSLVARVPVAAGGSGKRTVAYLASGLDNPTLARASALALVNAAAGLAVQTPRARRARPRPAATVLGRGAGTLENAINGAGPGSTTAVTAWVGGAKAPAVNVNGATLLPATGTVPLFIAAHGLPGAVATTRLSTRLVVDGTLAHATLNGSVGLVAGLDPNLSTADLAALAKGVVNLGIRKVTGGVAVDDLALAPTVPVTWPWPWLGAPPAVGGDALSVGDGLYSVAVLPGPRVGASPTVEVVPASTPVGVTDEALTTSGAGSHLSLWPDPASGRLVITGSIGLRDKLGTVLLRVAPDPGLAAGNLLLQDLKADGVSVAGGVRRTAIPSVAPTLTRSVGTSLVSLDDGLLANPTPAAAWDAAAVAGGALRGQTGLTAVDRGLAAVSGLLIHDGRGAPAPILSEPVGVGPDDRIASYGCAATLARLAASTGPQGQLPSLLPIVPTSAKGGTLHAMVGVGTGAGSLAGYFVPKHGKPIAVCVSITGATRDSSSALTQVAQAAAALAVAPAATAKPASGG